MPAFLAAIGAGPAWLGLIEGIADGLSSFAKLAAGHYTDSLKRRKPIALIGYAVTALGTASFAFATNVHHVLIGRSLAWLGRGVRSPAKKALLAADVSPNAYGRAFGLERLMDTVGAIAGPLTALWLLEKTGHNYHRVFLWTLLPGLVAVAAFWLLVQERPIVSSQKAFVLDGRPRICQRRSGGFFWARGCSERVIFLIRFSFFTLRVCRARDGTTRAASIAVVLYTVHNVFSAGSAYASGWLSDHVPQRKVVLAAGYFLAAITAILLCTSTHSIWVLGVIFVLGGLYFGIVDALEDSVAAELVPKEQHGMAFGTLAAVNAVGDFLSSILVGFLWSAVSVQAAFATSTVFFLVSALLVLRLRR